MAAFFEFYQENGVKVEVNLDQVCYVMHGDGKAGDTLYFSNGKTLSLPDRASFDAYIDAVETQWASRFKRPEHAKT